VLNVLVTVLRECGRVNRESNEARGGSKKASK
jgi:hypothetical protein